MQLHINVHNTECWFLFPFILLSICAGFIIKVINRLKWWMSFTSSFIINLVAAFAIHYLRPEFMATHQSINILYLVATLQYPFVLGMLLKKYEVLDRFRINWLLSVILIIGLTVIRCLTSNIWHIYYLLSLLFLLLQIVKFFKKQNMILSGLRILGKHSLNIWMIHSWFCFHLFQPQLYSLKYPVLIFTVTLTLSLIISVVVEKFFEFSRKLCPYE